MLTLARVPETPIKQRLVGGSHLGREHRRLGRNNQDSFALGHHRGLLVAVVTDGCSAGSRSELGAHLGARFLATTLLQRIRAEEEGTQERASDETWIDDCARSLDRLLGSMCRVLAPDDPSHREGLIAQYLLFGFLAVVVSPKRTLVLGIGDGVWAVNGRVHIIDPGPQNAPPYAAYRQLPELRANLGPQLQPQLHFAGPTAEVQSVTIATDGAIALEAAQQPKGDSRGSGLNQFLHPRYWHNPSLIQKRLRVIDERITPLEDDTTLAMVAGEGAI